MAEDTNLKDMVEELNRKLREMEEAKKQQEIEMSRLKAQLSEASLKLRGSKSSSNAECFLEESSQQLNETELVTYELEEEVVLEEELPIHMSDMKTEITIEDMENEGTEDQQDKDHLTCDLESCGQTFPEEELRNHLTHLEGKNTHTCSECGVSFQLASQLTLHLMTHTNSEPVVCFHSSEEFPEHSCLTENKGIHASDQANQEMPIVKEYFSCSEKEMEEEVPASENLYCCALCERRYSNELSLKFHVIKDHINMIADQNENTEDTDDSTKIQFAGTEISCNEKVTSDKKKLYYCMFCEKSYKNKGSLQLHVNWHTKPFACRYCGKTFAYKAPLLEHENIHQGLKPHTCDICGKNFRWRSNLHLHRMSHKEYRGEHKCETCGRYLASKHGLQLHEMTHTGERPFPCTLCDVSFRQPQHLKIHMQAIHEHVKNLVCSECSKTFTTMSNLRQHYSTHQPAEKIPCEMCNKLFSNKRNLKLHIDRLHSAQMRLEELGLL